MESRLSLTDEKRKVGMEIRLSTIRELRRISWKEVQLQYSTFLKMRPHLIEILENTLAELGVEKGTIKLEYSLDKLQWLNNLLPSLVKSRDLTPEEIQATLDDMPKEHWSIIKKFVLFTPESEYLLNLVGFFIGEMLILQNTSYYWALDKVKHSATYTQPILWGSSSFIQYAPLQTMNVVGHTIILDNNDDPELVLLYKKLILGLDGVYKYDIKGLE